MSAPGSETSRQAVNIPAPTQSNTPGTGVTILAASSTAANTAVPAALFGSYVYLRAEGDKIFVNFGHDSTPAIDKSKAGGATFTLGTSDQNAIVLSDGETRHMRLNANEHAYIKWQANANASKLIIQPLRVKGARRPRT